MKKYFSFLILSLAFSLFFVSSIFADEPYSPPYPPTDDKLEYTFGTVWSRTETVGYCPFFVTTNFEPVAYGSFYGRSTSTDKLAVVTVACAPYTSTDYGYKTFSSAYGPKTDYSTVHWSSLQNSQSNYFSRSALVTYNGQTWILAVAMSSYDSFTDIDSFGEGVFYGLQPEYISQGFPTGTLLDETALKQFWIDKALNYTVPVPENGSFNSSIPTFISASVSYNSAAELNFSFGESDFETPFYFPTFSGSLSSTLSDGSSFNSSTYTVDYAVSYTVYTYLRDLDSYSSNDLKFKNSLSYSMLFKDLENGTLDLSFVSSRLGTPGHVGSFAAPILYMDARGVSQYSVQNVIVSARLRRRSDGAFGRWYSIRAYSLGGSAVTSDLNGVETLEDCKPSFDSGITSGFSDSFSDIEGAFSQLDNNLNNAVDTITSFTNNGVSAGVSSGGSRLYEGGGYVPSVDIGGITTTFGQVPQLFAVVFSFLPPFVIEFIAMAFITTVAVAIVKAIL